MAIASVLALTAGGCVFVNASVDPFGRKPKPLEERVVSGEGDAKILLLDISRVITTQGEESSFGLRRRASVVERLEEELKRASKDDSVRALVVRVNSPGGTVTASDIVYRLLSDFASEQDVPVVAQLMDVAASGGYYAALAAGDIVAYPTTVTGSIGVVFHGISLEGLLDKIGVRNQTVKTGEKKDIGSPLRAMTDEERELLEGILGEMRDRFVALVRENRPQVTDDGQALISDGRIVSATQAKEIGLVDRIGALEDSIALARDRAGVKEARVVVYRRPNEQAGGIYAETVAARGPTDPVSAELRRLIQTPQFLYLWAPGGA